MSETQFESDPFLKLLTDALRAGPGSPQWHEAVKQLRASGGGAEADEYRLLCAARERLESGREYRTVRPGAGFTRKVMEGVEQQAAGRRRLPTANLIALLAGGAILIVLVVVATQMARQTGQQTAQAELGGIHFVNTVVSSDFAGGISEEWRTIGEAPTAVADGPAKGLRAAGSKSADYKGGGIVAQNPVAPAQSVAIETTLRMAKPTEQIVVQLFASDDPAFDRTPQATSPHEFVCWFANGQARVAMPDFSAVGQGSRLGAGPDPVSVHLSIRLNRRFAMVECEGQQIYAGPHNLAEDKPRWIGLRFLTRGGERTDMVTVQSIRVMKP